MDYDLVRYPEIAEIQNFIRNREIKICRSEISMELDDFIPMDLIINAERYTVWVKDEYNDLSYNNPILNFILVFREFELIEDSIDFLDWCKLNSANASNNDLLSYYVEQCRVIGNINRHFKEKSITCFISDLDFQLNSGVLQILRNKKV